MWKWPGIFSCLGSLPCRDTDLKGRSDGVFLPEGDGASLLGFQEEPSPVPGSNETLIFRAIRNIEATIEHAAAHYGLGISSCWGWEGPQATSQPFSVMRDRVKRVLQTLRVSVSIYQALPLLDYFLDPATISRRPWYP